MRRQRLRSSAGGLLKTFPGVQTQLWPRKSFEIFSRIRSGFRIWTRQNQLFPCFTNVFGAFCLQKRTRFFDLACFVRVLTSENAGLTFNIWAILRDPGRIFRVPGGSKDSPKSLSKDFPEIPFISDIRTQKKLWSRSRRGQHD